MWINKHSPIYSGSFSANFERVKFIDTNKKFVVHHQKCSQFTFFFRCRCFFLWIETKCRIIYDQSLKPMREDQNFFKKKIMSMFGTFPFDKPFVYSIRLNTYTRHLSSNKRSCRFFFFRIALDLDEDFYFVVFYALRSLTKTMNCSVRWTDFVWIEWDCVCVC